MSKYTAEQVRDWLVGKERAHACYQHWSVSLDEEMVRGFKDAIDALLRERESAKAGVTDEIVYRACKAGRITRDEPPEHELAAMRRKLEAVAPMLASARVPDGYTALLSDGKRYWSDKPGQHGEWFPYYLGAPTPKPEKE